MFIVIENTPGYMPDADEPADFEEYADAVAYMRSKIERYCEEIVESGASFEVSEGWASQGNYAAAVVYRSDRSHDLGRCFAVELVEE